MKPGGVVRVPLVAVVGAGRADERLREHARDVGAAIAAVGAGVVCGGLDGVMEAACRGAAEQTGNARARTVAILPGDDPAAANPWVEISVATGLGQARNVLVVLSAQAVVAVGGGAGTLSEIGHAAKAGRPLAAYLPAGGPGAQLARDPEAAVRVEPIPDLAELERWLLRVLPRAALRRPLSPRSSPERP